MTKKKQGLMILFTVVFVALLVSGITGKIRPPMEMPGDKLERIRKERNETRARLKASERNLKYAEFMGRINAGRHKIEQAKRKEAEAEVANLKMEIAEIDPLTAALGRSILEKELEIQKLQEQTNEAQEGINDVNKKSIQSSRGLPRIEQQTSEGVGTGQFIGRFYASAYCRCAKCCGPWANTDQGSKGLPGGVATDSNTIPRGTKVYIEGHGPAIANDSGSKIKGMRIDIAFATHQEALNWGMRWVNVYHAK